MIGSIII